MQTEQAARTVRVGQAASQRSVRGWWRSGTPWVWLTAGAVSVSVMMVVGLIAMIAWRGLGHFWPGNIAELRYVNEADTHESLIGRVVGESDMPLAQYVELTSAQDVQSPRVERWQLKTGNRDKQPPDFRWLYRHRIASVAYPGELVEVERLEWGSLFGRLRDVVEQGRSVAHGAAAIIIFTLL